MAITSGFFNAQVDEFGVADRLYDAEQMSSIFDGIIRDGVFAFIGDKFKVTVGGGNAVNIGTGRAWFDHVWILNDAVYPLVIPAAEVVLDRIDVVVFDIDRDIGVRNGSISVIKGIPSSAPSRPAMIRQEERNTYPIAYIRRRAGRSLTQADITVVVGTGETPFVTGPLETIGVDLFVDSMYDDWLAWFDSVKDILNDTPVGNLMNRIMDFEAQIDRKIGDINLNVKDFGASGSSLHTKGSTQTGSNTITLDSVIDFEVGQGVLIAGVGSSKKEVLTVVIESHPSQTGVILLDIPNENIKTFNVTAEKEVVNLTVTSGATMSGNIHLVIDGDDFSIPVSSGESVYDINNRIKNWYFEGWLNTFNESSGVVTLTARDAGYKNTIYFYDGLTGVDISVTRVQEGSLSRPTDIVKEIRETTFDNWTPSGIVNSNVVHLVSKMTGSNLNDDVWYYKNETGVDGRVEVAQYGNYLSSKIVDITGNVIQIDDNVQATVVGKHVIHDDTKAIQTTLNTQNVAKVLIPSGTFNLSEQLKVNKNTIVSGVGDKSVLQMVAVGKTCLSMTSADGVTIEFLKIKNVTSPRVYFGQDIETHGIVFDKSSGGLVQNCTVDNSDDAGIRFSYGNDVRIINNNIVNISEGHGIELISASNTTTIGNNVEYVSQHGIRICGTISSITSENFLKNCDIGIAVQGFSTRAGVVEQRTTNFIISRNQMINNNAGFSIVSESNTGVIDGNSISTNLNGRYLNGFNFRASTAGGFATSVSDIYLRGNTVKGYGRPINVLANIRNIFIESNQLFIGGNSEGIAYGVYFSGGYDVVSDTVVIKNNTFTSYQNGDLGVVLSNATDKTKVEVHGNSFIFQISYYIESAVKTNAIRNLRSSDFPNALIKEKIGVTTINEEEQTFSIDTNTYIMMDN